MRVILGEGRRGPAAAIAFVLGALALLSVTIVEDRPVQKVAPVIAVAIALVIWSPLFNRWRNILAGLLIVILFIPIKRYALPGNLPFQLEPYRLVVAAMVLGWIASMLVDKRTRLRASGFEGPLILIVGTTFVSDAVNPGRVGPLATDVLKSLTFFVSFLFVFYLVVSVVRRRSDVDFLVKVLIGGGAIVAAAAIYERRTNYNVFNHLDSIAPFLRYVNVLNDASLERGGRLRVYGPAQHPIALSVLFVLLLPLAIYLAQKTRERKWIVAICLFVFGILATASRTGVIGLVVVLLVFLWLQPRAVRRLWPALLPALVAIHLVLPGALGTVRASFFPRGGLVAEQDNTQSGNVKEASGRLADIGPSLSEWSNKPLLGEGYSTRVTVGPNANARLLDDQWLGTLLEIGYFGFLAWVWLFGRSVRRFAAEAKRAGGEDGWLLTALAASIAAFGVAMVTYDAFSFIQTTFVFFIELALGAVMLQLRRGGDVASGVVPIR